MIQTYIFTDDTDEGLQNNINDFLKEIKEEDIIDIKFSTTVFDYQDKNVLGTEVERSAMIIYRER